jgi:hypothetical protein
MNLINSLPGWAIVLGFFILWGIGFSVTICLLAAVTDLPLWGDEGELDVVAASVLWPLCLFLFLPLLGIVKTLVKAFHKIRSNRENRKSRNR